jgi:hypothetical protein
MNAGGTQAGTSLQDKNGWDVRTEHGKEGEETGGFEHLSPSPRGLVQYLLLCPRECGCPEKQCGPPC